MSYRKNDGKLRLSLMIEIAKSYMCQALHYGYKKYDSRNAYKDGDMTICDCLDSLERHLTRFKLGEDIDPESGVNHIGHMLSNLGMMADLFERRPELDDRVKYNDVNLDKLLMYRGN